MRMKAICNSLQFLSDYISQFFATLDNICLSWYNIKINISF